MLPVLGIIGAIGIALAAGAVVYLLVKLTIRLIKQYRKRKDTKIVMAQVKELVKDPSVAHMSMSDLDEDDVVIAEYDEDTDELVQCNLSNDVDQKVENLLNRNDGVLIIED